LLRFISTIKTESLHKVKKKRLPKREGKGWSKESNKSLKCKRPRGEKYTCRKTKRWGGKKKSQNGKNVGGRKKIREESRTNQRGEGVRKAGEPTGNFLVGSINSPCKGGEENGQKRSGKDRGACWLKRAPMPESRSEPATFVNSKSDAVTMGGKRAAEVERREKTGGVKKIIPLKAEGS